MFALHQWQDVVWRLNYRETSDLQSFMQGGKSNSFGKILGPRGAQIVHFFADRKAQADGTSGGVIIALEQRLVCGGAAWQRNDQQCWPKVSCESGEGQTSVEKSRRNIGPVGSSRDG